jgi:hypothetical protein
VNPADAPDEPTRKYRAYVCASVTTENETNFKSAYDDQIDAAFSKSGSQRRKRVYKAAHLTRQLEAQADESIPYICETLADEVSELSIYHCYFDRPFISAYGKGRGQRFHPEDFIKRNADLLLHFCALKHAQLSEYGDGRIQMDNFEADMTSAWNLLTGLDCQKEIYISGGECNALISIADLVLRVINWHQHGWVDPTSILRPIREHLPKLSKKLKFYEVGKSTEDLKLLVPTIKLSVPKREFFKHPIFFLLWNADRPRKITRPAFEWSPPYNATMSRAFDEAGCVKAFASEEDHFYWDPSRDYLVPWSEDEEEIVKDLRRMSYDLPKVLTLTDLGLRSDKPEDSQVNHAPN